MHRRYITNSTSISDQDIFNDVDFDLSPVFDKWYKMTKIGAQIEVHSMFAGDILHSLHFYFLDIIP